MAARVTVAPPEMMNSCLMLPLTGRTILFLALASAGFTQHFEHDLRPPVHSDWLEAGAAVDIDGEWAIVSGSNSTVLPQPESLPAMFRRDTATGEWHFSQSLVQPNMGSFYFGGEHVAIDGPHALVGSPRTIAPGIVIQPWELDPSTGTWIPGPYLTPPTPGAVSFGQHLDLSGTTALVTDFSFDDEGIVHRYEYDTGASAWTFAESWPAPAGAGSFGFAVDLDGETAVVSDLNQNVSQSSRVHVYEKGTSGWVSTQVITGGQGSPPRWTYGSRLALDGDLLVLVNHPTVEVFRRAGPGLPFLFDALVFLGPNHAASSIDVERDADGETIVVGEQYECSGGTASCDGLVSVWRQVPCMGSGWQRTHALHTAHRHNADVGLGAAVAISESRVVAGMPGYAFLNGPFHGQRAGAASVFDIPLDGDGNGIDDPCDILAGAADLDEDGVLDEIEAVGRRYCSPGTLTSLGAPAFLLMQGTDVPAADRLFFTFLGVPTGAAGLMLASQSPGFTAGPGGSQGNLCLGQPIGRYAGRTHSYWFATGDGVISQRYPTISPLPGGGAMVAGETWYFQGWFRDSGSSNFTDGIQMVMR